MNFRLKCENPGKIEYTLTATMTADEWEAIREALREARAFGGPPGQLIAAVNDMLAQARKIYWPSDNGGDSHG